MRHFKTLHEAESFLDRKEIEVLQRVMRNNFYRRNISEQVFLLHRNIDIEEHSKSHQVEMIYQMLQKMSNFVLNNPLNEEGIQICIDYNMILEDVDE